MLRPHTRDDEPHNEAWQAVFDNGDEVQECALHPRLGAMNVHTVHRIFHHRSVLVCVKCGGSSMWVNRKLRRDCPGNPSKLGMEVLKRMAKRKTPSAKARVACPSTWRRQPRWLWRVFERHRGHLVPCPILHGASGGWTRARAWEREWAFSLRRCHAALECGMSVFKSSFFFVQFSVELRLATSVHNACSARSFPLVSCFVVAALTTLLSDSVDRPSTKNSTGCSNILVIASAVLFKTNTPGCCWFSTRSSCASRSSVVDNTRRSVYAFRRTWNVAAWRMCELQCGFSCLQRVTTWTPGCCRNVHPLNSEGTCCNIACTFVVVISHKSMHWTVMSLLLCNLPSSSSMASYHLFHTVFVFLMPPSKRFLCLVFIVPLTPDSLSSHF